MDYLRLVVASMAVYRVAHMLAREDGPFDLFTRWRDRIGQRNWIGRGFHCVLCISFWLSIPAALWVLNTWITGLIFDMTIFWLAIAGLVLVFHQLEGKNE